MATTEGESRQWLGATWSFAKQILPLLLVGVFAAGFLLGRPGHEGVIPSQWVTRAVGGNSLQANFFASFAGAFMYFARGPALALLLAGPALSLPNMLVLRTVMGARKTAVYVGLVIVMATITGVLFGMF